MESNIFSRRDQMLKPGTGELIKNCPVAVFGVGSLGNAVLENLVLMGFCKFLIVDMDKVESSNLTKSPLFSTADIGIPKVQAVANALRQRALTDNIEVKYIDGNIMTDVGKSVFWDYKVIVSAVDTMDCRAYINDWCLRAGTPLFVEGGFSGRNGDVSFFTPDNDGTYHHCLRQLIGQGSFDGKRNSCSGLKVHDSKLDVIPVIQTTSAIAGAIIAQEIVKFLEGTATLLNKTLCFNGNTLVNTIMEHGTCGGCPLHEEASVAITELTVPTDATARQVLHTAVILMGVSHPILILPEPYVIKGQCHKCGKSMTIELRLSQMWDNDRWCTECRETDGHETALMYPSEWKVVSELTLQSDDEVLNRKLRQLGVPKDDVLQIMSHIDGEIVCQYVRLKEDAPMFVVSSASELEPYPIERGAEAYYCGHDELIVDRVHLSLAINNILAGDNLVISSQPLQKESHPKANFSSNYHCFIEDEAFNEFLFFALNVYNTTGNEATGVFAGYWLADGDKRYAYCYRFLPAYGNGTATTCSIEPEDYGRFAEYCRKHKLTQLVWVHSHPGFGAFFSGTDDNTLRTLYHAQQYMGIVVDILSGDMVGYKMVDGVRCEQSFEIVDTKVEE